jgi:Mrp family chromosome partitioning ATPase
MPGYPDLCVLPAGPASRRAADRSGQALGGILAEAGKEFDLVIIDAPPMLGFAEPLQIAALVDGVAIVIKAGETHRNALQSVLGVLKRIQANVVGVVLNEVSDSMSDQYYYYGYYGKYYSKYYNREES